MGQEHVAKVGSFIKWTLVTNAGPWMYFHAVVLLIKLMGCKLFTGMVVVSEASHVVEVERSVEEHLLVCVREYPKRIARRRVEIHIERHKLKWGGSCSSMNRLTVSLTFPRRSVVRESSLERNCSSSMGKSPGLNFSG